MKTPYLNFREGPPKRVLAYTVATVLLLMSSLPISAAQPQAKFTVTPSSGTVPLEVKLDASQSSPADNLTYHWFFAEILKKITSLGTKTSTSPKTEIIFANPGTHDIILIVLDKNGRMDVARQTFVGIDPSDEKGSETSPTGGDGSTGDGGTSDNPPTGGDGPTGDGETSDNGPTGDGEEQPTPAPANKPPLANFTYTVTPEQGPGPFTVSLDGSSSSDEDGTIVKYEWHSDGKTKSGESVDFVFQKADTYQVKLTVTDDKGATSPMTQVVIIKEPPPPPQFDYNTTARVYPQVIAAGVTPSKVDLEDTQFEIVALVRPGATAIKRVTLQDTTGKVLAPEMTLAGVLPNGDELYKVTYVVPRGMDEMTFPTAWGSEPGQFNIIAKGNQNHQSHTYPYLKIGSHPEQDNTSVRKDIASPSYDTTARYAPQVIMAGYSPALLDNAKQQIEFDVIAVVRQGNLPIKHVKLKQSGSEQFDVGMNLAGELDNGDKVYKFSFSLDKDELVNIDEKSLLYFKNLWGPDATQFGIEVVDEGEQTSHKFPDIEFGNYPELKR